MKELYSSLLQESYISLSLDLEYKVWCIHSCSMISLAKLITGFIRTVISVIRVAIQYRDSNIIK